MIITIGKPSAVSEKGGRLNNEDAIYPLPESPYSNQKLFLVCDGVGGSEKGEVASALACEYFRIYFGAFLEDEPSAEFIHKALQYTELHFDHYVTSHADSRGMATTLCLIHIGSFGATFAHVGDSRIYQFRNGKIRYKTEDHSLVNSLVKLGKITEEEAISHPQKNVIIRAIQGTDHPTEVDVVLVSDIQPGDFLFMCTDGVLETLTDQKLSAIFESNNDPDSIKDAIMESCKDKTRDNFSFYIIPVCHVQKSGSIKQNIVSFLYSFV